MKTLIKFSKFTWLLVSVLVLSNCDDKEEAVVMDDPQIKLEVPASIGHAQYRVNVESGQSISVPVSVSTDGTITLMEITKTVNLEIDNSFGENGTLTVLTTPSGSSFDYSFDFTPTTNDVDKLVGFTFKVQTLDGRISKSDLTLVVTLSPRDNLSRRRWNLRSVLHVNNEDNPNEESINDCEKDNSMLLNADGTMEMDYGSETGEGDCLFDGFNVYTGWELTEDETYFIRTSYGIFSPDVTVIDTFVVNTLTVDRFSIEQSVDMSAFGLSSDEKFLYIYHAGPR